MLRRSAFGDHAAEQVDWRVTVRVVVHRRRGTGAACRCEGPRTVTAPGPPKAIGKGLFSNGFIAMLLVERYVAGRSQNSLIVGLARHGAEYTRRRWSGPARWRGRCSRRWKSRSWPGPAIPGICTPTKRRGTCSPPIPGWPGSLVAVGVHRRGHHLFRDGPDPRRAVLARHAGIDADTGQLTPDEDGGPRRLVISSDFYTVYASAGKKTDGLTNLYCWAHIRRYFVRAGDANPAQLAYWTRDWLDRIKNLYPAHDELTAAWNASVAPAPRTAAAAAARLEHAYTAWDTALDAIDTARRTQMTSPGLQQPAKKALATLDREWDGLAAHRDYPMISLDNNAGERALRRPVVTRKNAYGSRTDDAARLAATIWTVTATAERPA